MKSIVITILASVTAITCSLLLRVEHTPGPPRYQLHSIDETSSANGKTVKSVYRLDIITGKTWRMSSNPVPTASKDQQNNSIVMWADGWEEMPESPEAAVAKARAEYQRAVSH